jgi:hypothetical protein
LDSFRAPGKTGAREIKALADDLAKTHGVRFADFSRQHCGVIVATPNR